MNNHILKLQTLAPAGLLLLVKFKSFNSLVINVRRVTINSMFLVNSLDILLILFIPIDILILFPANSTHRHGLAHFFKNVEGTT